MKKAMSIWAFPGDWGLDRVFTVAKDAGFNGVEVALDEKGLISLESGKAEAESVKKMADDAGIELFSLATGLYWKYSLTSSDAGNASMAKKVLRKQIETAAWLGCDTILVVPGAVGVGFAPELGVVRYDIAYERALEAIKDSAGFAGDNGVSIGIENVWNKFLLSPLEMRGFIDSAGSSAVGAYFDVGNVLYDGYPEQWIRILGKRIKKVHFKDYRLDAGGLHGFVDLLAGDVNYPEVMRAFSEIGYDGWVTAETIPAYRHYSDQIIHNTSASMDRIFKGA